MYSSASTAWTGRARVAIHNDNAFDHAGEDRFGPRAIPRLPTTRPSSAMSVTRVPVSAPR